MTQKKWRALDHCNNDDNGVEEQEKDAVSSLEQYSFEWIIVKDSEGVTVDTIDTQAALQLQANLQIVLGTVITAIVGDVNGQVIAQEISELTKTSQSNSQKTIIEGSRNVTVNTIDTDAALNIQASVQAILASFITAIAGDINGG